MEELEATLGKAILEKQQVCPEGTVANMVMGLAFDNYGELSDSLSGANTIHNTIWILYQSRIRCQELVKLTSSPHM